MNKTVFALTLILLGSLPAHAQTDVLIEIDRGRTEGIFTRTPVYQRAILTKPAGPADTALLFFRGFPGIGRIESVKDKLRNLIGFMRLNQQLLYEAGIALVIVDCPTDQWGSPAPYPTTCLDNYRSSPEHADDVRSVIARLRNEHGYSKFYVMGHSMGTISSRWLAKNLGKEIDGSIHSAAMNGSNPRGFASSVSAISYNTIAAPVLHVHNENDACRSTPYAPVKQYARDNLVTVRGGIPEGDPCGGTHLHSHQGREEIVVNAIVKWIKTRQVDALVGE